MSTCPVCGRVHLIVWPQFWPYRRGAKLFCSEDCLIVFVTQQNFSKYKGVQKKMARLKKDGTPAKKPGRKPNKIEIPEPVAGGKWEKMETPEAEKIEIVEIPESSGHFHNSDRTPPPPPRPKKTETPLIMATVTPEGPKDFGKLIREKRYTVTAISYPDIGEFYYDRKYNSIDWRTIEGDEVSMSPTGWKLLLQDLPEVFKELGVEL